MANTSLYHLLLGEKYLQSKSGTKQSLVLANKISLDILCSGLKWLNNLSLYGLSAQAREEKGTSKREYFTCCVLF